MSKNESKRVIETQRDVAQGDPCRGCQGPAAALHTCPYQEDVNDDSAFRCNCCGECEQECAEDI